MIAQQKTVDMSPLQVAYWQWAFSLVGMKGAYVMQPDGTFTYEFKSIRPGAPL